MYGRVTSVDDVRSLLRCRGAVRRLRLRLIDGSLGRSWAVVGLLGGRRLVAGLRLVDRLRRGVGGPWWSIRRLLGWRGLVGCLGGLERLNVI